MQFQCNKTTLKITTNFTDDVHVFSLKFTVNANIVYIPAEATFSTSIVCPSHYGQYFSQLVYRSVYCVLALIPAEPFNRTERTLDNQL